MTFGQPQPKICLISPRGPLYRHTSGIWKKSLRYAPLTLTTLASLVPEDLNAEVELFDEGIREIDPNLNADLIGISAITGTAPRSYELADHFRARGIPVVLGGVHPTLLPDEAQRHASSVVVGYAEETFPQLLRDFSQGVMKERYVQSPDLSLSNLPRAKRELLPAKNYSTRFTFEATRGCVHQCDFCVVPTAWGRPLQKPVAEVVEDIRVSGGRKIIFLDLNLIADLDYARELFKALRALKISWYGLVTTLIALDGELLTLAAESGCKGVLIGFESLSPEVLKETHKRFNQHMDYRYVIRQLHKHGIAIMGCFVFGFDGDDEHVFERTVDFVNDAAIDLPRYSILTPFPGTPLFQRLKAEGRLLTENWEEYDGQHVVFQPKQMTPHALNAQTEWAWKKTYSIRSIASRLAKARIQLPLTAACNFGYRYYAYRLQRFYTCRSFEA